MGTSVGVRKFESSLKQRGKKSHTEYHCYLICEKGATKDRQLKYARLKDKVVNFLTEGVSKTHLSRGVAVVYI